MKNSRMKKLTLNKETLRNLQDSQLGQVVGGAQNVTCYGCGVISARCYVGGTDICIEKVRPGFARPPGPPNMSDDCPATHYCSILGACP